MVRKNECEQVYVCGLCEHISNNYNRNICQSCGGLGTRKEKVARWVSTTTFWQAITARTSGYWEVKEVEIATQLDRII